MNEQPLSLNDPIVALATPWGKSAVAVIRTSGEHCLVLADEVFRGNRRLVDCPGHTLIHGHVVDPADGESVDEVLAAVFRAPRSYTGEDVVEFSVHGGLPTIARVLSLLGARGFRDAAPGEFTLRAFTNNKLDLTRAEAVNDIVNSRSDRARALAFSRLSGALFSAIETAKRRLVDVLAGIEVMIDYPDEPYEHATTALREVETTAAELAALARTYASGRVYQEGAVVAVAGRTNSGKSTLFNLLLKEDRSIVSDEHGTTRDFIEGAITIDGIPIRLIDTAGLRETAHRVEEEGIRRSRRVLENADLILYLVDATAGLTAEDEPYTVRHAGGKPTIGLWTKIDAADKPAPPGFIPFSAVTRLGLPELETAVRRALLGNDLVAPGTGEGQASLIDSLRQKEALEEAYTALNRVREGIEKNSSYDLLAADLREAVDALGRITGEVMSADILEAVFSKFCVGK